ncbi:MAG: ABC-three component system protein [Planctomycetaceae bacterium]
MVDTNQSSSWLLIVRKRVLSSLPSGESHDARLETLLGLKRMGTPKEATGEFEQSFVGVENTGMTPWKIIQSYDDKTWEQFIAEWAEGFDPPYQQIVPLGGAGDKGRDIVAYIGEPTDPASAWDSYQCKHYRSPLTPTDIYLELGKLCYYTQRGDYSIPRRYRFVSPLGVGTKLHDMLKKPAVLRADLLANWDKYCRHGIQTAEVPLDDALRKYIDDFDFTIVWFLTHTEILEQHERTKYWYRRFKVEPPSRPEVTDPPVDVKPAELGYIQCLLEAYSDKKKTRIASVEELSETPKLEKHFKNSRYCFYLADALARFSRDHFGIHAFDGIKRHVYDGVIDVTFANHANGFECVIEVTKTAATLQLPASDIAPHVSPADKKGLCHHLANDGAMKWCGHE